MYILFFRWDGIIFRVFEKKSLDRKFLCGKLRHQFPREAKKYRDVGIQEPRGEFDRDRSRDVSKNKDLRCHVHGFLNEESGTFYATLFSSTVENFIGFTAAELLESDEKNAPLTDEIARKIDKKSVVCFLKYYDNNFRNKAERTYSVVKLYTEEELNQTATQSSSNMTVDEIEPSLQGSPSMDAEKEKQLFSPSTKKVIEEIALTAGMLKGTMLPCPPTKRGIMFTGISGENQDVLLSQVVPSAAEETDAPTLGSESPVKKLKNKQTEERSGN